MRAALGKTLRSTYAPNTVNSLRVMSYWGTAGRAREFMPNSSTRPPTRTADVTSAVSSRTVAIKAVHCTSIANSRNAEADRDVAGVHRRARQASFFCRGH
jgi:hypothetical protein